MMRSVMVGSRLDSDRWLFTVATELDVLRVCRAAQEVALLCGFSIRTVYQIIISTSELATNLIAHAHGGGRISLARIVRHTGAPRLHAGGISDTDVLIVTSHDWARSGLHPRGIEVVAEDDGPGIADVDVVMRDGYSTIGTLGVGLPSVRRLMSEFAIHSQVGAGTRVIARKWLPWK
jgi:serine/threonine-protein kinase RsbT